jgi:hypothetical protein
VVTDSSSTMLANAAGGTGGGPGAFNVLSLQILCGIGGAGGSGTASPNSISRTGTGGQSCSNLVGLSDNGGLGGLPPNGSVVPAGGQGAWAAPLLEQLAQQAMRSLAGRHKQFEQCLQRLLRGKQARGISRVQKGAEERTLTFCCSRNLLVDSLHLLSTAQDHTCSKRPELTQADHRRVICARIAG